MTKSSLGQRILSALFPFREQNTFKQMGALSQNTVDVRYKGFVREKFELKPEAGPRKTTD